MCSKVLAGQHASGSDACSIKALWSVAMHWHFGAGLLLVLLYLSGPEVAVLCLRRKLPSGGRRWAGVDCKPLPALLLQCLQHMAGSCGLQPAVLTPAVLSCAHAHTLWLADPSCCADSLPVRNL